MTLGSPSLTICRDGLWDTGHRTILGGWISSPHWSELSQWSILWPIPGFAAKGRHRTYVATTGHLLTSFCPAIPSAFPLRGIKTRGTEVACAVQGAGAAQETTLLGSLHGRDIYLTIDRILSIQRIHLVVPSSFVTQGKM